MVGNSRPPFALGQYPGRVQAGQNHDGPQESADHGPQHASAQSGTTLGRIALVGPLAEDVLVREGRETEYRAKQKEHGDVDVQGDLPDERQSGPPNWVPCLSSRCEIQRMYIKSYNLKSP